MNAMQQKILDAALHLFIKKGIKSTEVDDIAVNAGISRKAIITNFANKEHILEACVNSEIEKYRQYIFGVNNSGQSAVEKLQAVYRYGFQLAPVFHPIFMFSLQKYYPELNAQCVQFEAELFGKHIAPMLAEGRTSGILNPLLDIPLALRLQQVCFSALFQQHNKLVIEFGKEKVMDHAIKQLVDPIKN